MMPADRKLRRVVAPQAEAFIAPSGATVGRLTGSDSEYAAAARNWAHTGSSYHKVRSALMARLVGRGWVMP